MPTNAHADLIRALPEDLRTAIESIVDYNWASEATDFERAEDEGNSRDGHVFLALQTVRTWLTSMDRLPAPRDLISDHHGLTVAELREVFACADEDTPVHLARSHNGVTDPITVAMFDSESEDTGILIYTCEPKEL